MFRRRQRLLLRLRLSIRTNYWRVCGVAASEAGLALVHLDPAYFWFNCADPSYLLRTGDASRRHR